jgi:ABC-type phosphate transport system auxiliary subunit
MQGSREIPVGLLPTFVTFSDLNDPKTARVVQPHEFPQVFGVGVRFRRITIEVTRDAVTRIIEQRMPTLIATLREQAQKMQVRRVGDPYVARLGHFSIGG